ncbi:MAG: NAD(P)H-dependent oxidoreductase [Burkholderiales bacterium]
MGQYSHEHTKTWSAKIASFDAYVFVTPEYNHATSAALKNAIEFLYHEWVNKAAGFVGYGGASGTRAVEKVRLMMGELQVADVKAQVGLSLLHRFRGLQRLQAGSPARELCQRYARPGYRLGRRVEPAAGSEHSTPRSQLMNDQSENVALVAGANRGIGLEVCRQLACRACWRATARWCWSGCPILRCCRPVNDYRAGKMGHLH